MTNVRKMGILFGRTSLVAALFALALSSLRAQTNLSVAPDGSAPFKSVQEAIMAVPSGSASQPVVIHIKPGTYKELIYIQREKRFFRLVGENATNTVLTYDLHANLPGPAGKPIGTFRTPSTIIDADDFTAENITFENSAGPKGQALAIRLDGDRAAFRNCRFLGWQDTILANRGRDYFENCYIAGHVDFIFGAATCFFERCHIHCLRDGYITAASTPEDQPFGFVFSNCLITGVTPEVRTYLGRPWRIHASTIFLNTRMSEVVRPVGWNNWQKPEAEKTARYAEFNCAGPGANQAARAPWARQLSKSEAAAITLKAVLGGSDGWEPLKQFLAADSSDRSDPPGTVTASASATIVIVDKLQRDLEYATATGQSLRLDACAPTGTGPFPVAIMVHGGGWSGGDKAKEITPVLDALTKAQFTWFSVNYRLAPTNRWPACFEDVQTAIRWVKAHAMEYRGDPGRIALIGYSAGGHLVCLAAALAKDDTRVQAVVGLAAPTDLMGDTERRGGLSTSLKNLLGRKNADDEVRATLRDISPINHLHPGLPPFLLIHGTADKSVLFQQSVDFQARLKENRVPCDLITITNAPHSIAKWDDFDASYKDKMVDWLKRTLGAPQL